MKNRPLEYASNFLMFFSVFVIAISLRKGYAYFLGLPLWAYIYLASILGIISVIQFFFKKKSKNFQE